MAEVAPEQHSMSIKPVVCPPELQPQPKIPGNGCPCKCCGASPPAIVVEKIKLNGNKHTKWIQLSDGSVVEYYVYGAEAADAEGPVLVQLNGTLGSAKFFSEMVSIQTVLKEMKVRAISINLPGYGFTTANPTRKMGDFAKTYVEPVLMAENLMVTDSGESVPLLVEGSSFGAAHAQNVMWHFQDRVVGMHLHVPAMAQDLAKSLNLKPITQGCHCNSDLVTSCFLLPSKQWCVPPCFPCLPCCCMNSPMLFCCCSCMAPFIPGGADGLVQLPEWNTIAEEYPQMKEKEFAATEIMKQHSMGHAIKNGIHGVVCFLL